MLIYPYLLNVLKLLVPCFMVLGNCSSLFAFRCPLLAAIISRWLMLQVYFYFICPKIILAHGLLFSLLYSLLTFQFTLANPCSLVATRMYSLIDVHSWRAVARFVLFKIVSTSQFPSHVFIAYPLQNTTPFRHPSIAMCSFLFTANTSFLLFLILLYS